MISHSCDVCGSACENVRITIKGIITWRNGVGREYMDNFDFCSAACLKRQFNDVLHKGGFLSEGVRLLITDQQEPS